MRKYFQNKFLGNPYKIIVPILSQNICIDKAKPAPGRISACSGYRFL